MIKAPKTDTEFRISYAQSWNLAVAMVSNLKYPKMEIYQEEMEKWQKYFYQKLVLDLVEKEGTEALNKLNSDRPDKVEKHKLDYVYDLPEQE